MRKSDVHEVLAMLYLRLNGYFTTGLILHSPEWGQARTEIDCLAIRHPYHRQSERGVETSDFLCTQVEKMDLILCEVKSDPEELRFNSPVRTDLEALRAALRWVGLFTEEQVGSIADRLQPLLQDDVPLDSVRRGVVEGRCRVRPLLCCPPCSKPDPDKWCLGGTEIFCFANQCFNPPERRDSCSTRYNFQNNQIDDPMNLEGLYQHLGAA